MAEELFSGGGLVRSATSVADNLANSAYGGYCVLLKPSRVSVTRSTKATQWSTKGGWSLAFVAHQLEGNG